MSEPAVEKLLVDMARILVDKTEDVLVVASTDDRGTILRLKVHPSDIGKVIGRQGRTARSLRTILAALGSKDDHRYYLDIVEDRGQATEEK